MDRVMIKARMEHYAELKQQLLEPNNSQPEKAAIRMRLAIIESRSWFEPSSTPVVEPSPQAKINALKEKREELEQQLLEPNIREPLEVSIRNRLAAISREIAAWYSCLPPVPATAAAPTPLATLPRGLSPDGLQRALLHEQFRDVIRCFHDKLAATEDLSDPSRPPETALHDALRAMEQKCVVCGWRLGTEEKEKEEEEGQEKEEESDYPCAAAQLHHVSIAPLLKNREQCRHMNVPFDVSNFLLLCGAKDEVPSCRAAFDSFRLCFAAASAAGEHAYTVLATEEPYDRFNETQVDLSAFQPHFEILHGHAVICLENGFVKPPRQPLEFDVIPPRPDEIPEDDDLV
jgi:hypothetical protein